MTNIKIISAIDKWIQQNEYYGYDIYDLYDNIFFTKLITNKSLIIRKILRKIISWFIRFFPSLTIIVTHKKKNINPKAMGLLLKAYCNLYQTSKDEYFLSKAIEISDWLVSNISKGLNGYGWGYPFNWSGSKYFPKFTPSSVVSTVVGDGFFALYKLTNNEKYIGICNEICNFLINDLNIDKIDKNTICFSYTPIDNNHVHNANLFTSEFLIRIGKELNIQQYIDLGKKAINYTLKEQKSNGSILYWGKQDSKRMKLSHSKLDHYHSGFEIRCLWKISKMLNDKDIYNAYRNYYEFYKQNYIGIKEIYLIPLKKYPINIHGCAEAIICNVIIEDGKYANEKWLINIIEWINNTMLDKDNLYIYEINKFLCFKIKTRFKFLRWSQAWMFLALTEHLKAVIENNYEEKNCHF